MTADRSWSLKEQILKEIAKKGGWVNTHAHFDRAYTISGKRLLLMNKLREEKWILNKDIRKSSSVDDIYGRMARATETLLGQGCFTMGTFIDVDRDVKDKAIRAATKLQTRYKNVVFKFLNQSSYGILNKKARDWFEVGADFVDIIGGLLKADAGRESAHLDILMQAAKSRKKMLHVHVDENNIPAEDETQMLAKKTIEHGMEGKVVGIHGISINCHPKNEREKLYILMKKARLMMIACPMSWINARRRETPAPIHNPVTPLDELASHGIIVGLGLDNIADIFMAFNDGNLWNDLRLLMECNRYYDIDEIVRVATINGRKILGIQ